MRHSVPSGDDRGRGLWLVDEAGDPVQVRSGAHGTVVGVRVRVA